jgi:CRISPR-associated endonuclease/helicase Cas3
MLCIVNTRGHAKALFDLIQHQPGAAHLTTLMYPAHRRAILARIKTDLKDGRPVRLVATSLVEAGVDFSFPEVWRAETGLDSIAQAAGRCNREGGPVRGRVVVFKPAELVLPRVFRAFQQAAQGPLRMEDPLGLAAVEAYFKNLYFDRRFEALDTKEIDGRTGILPAIDLAARSLDFPFAEIAQKFKMIDDVMWPVIIARDEPAKKALAAMNGEIPPGWALRRLQLYTVSIPQAAWQGLAATGAIQRVNPKFGDRFMKLVAENLYDEATGLRLDDPTARSAEHNII